MKAPTLAPILGLMVSCGSPNAPAIVDLVLTRDQPRRGEIFFARLFATDADGDLNGGVLALEAMGEGERVSDEVEVYGLKPEATSAELSVQLQLVGALDPGAYVLDVVVSDETGNASNALRAPFELR
ncbi:MAG: hypothetical protein HYV07_07015 [Deltaproteobacteria bacterium]|nr:hypothetical protein [Deltaproteobacteria bacterium]